ncbi:hypothetical protein D6817_04600, partial [Candidatus Pacearchaeota archaeon]
ALGIGITAPYQNSRLIVSGHGFNGGRAIFESKDHANSILINGATGPSVNDVSFIALGQGSDTNGVFIGRTGPAAGGAAGSLRFAVNGQERMRITPSGKVGIGTNNPAYTLDVNGDVRGTRLCIGTDCRSSWPGGGSGGGGGGSVWSVTPANNIYYLAGNVSIGTFPSTGDKLHVEGNIYATESIISRSGPIVAQSGDIVAGGTISGASFKLPVQNNAYYRRATSNTWRVNYAGSCSSSERGKIKVMEQGSCNFDALCWCGYTGATTALPNNQYQWMCIDACT